jgi:hypothetical protein
MRVGGGVDDYADETRRDQHGTDPGSRESVDTLDVLVDNAGI